MRKRSSLVLRQPPSPAFIRKFNILFRRKVDRIFAESIGLQRIVEHLDQELSKGSLREELDFLFDYLPHTRIRYLKIEVTAEHLQRIYFQRVRRMPYVSQETTYLSGLELKIAL